ncbi:MAG: hypothetical protein DWQ10_17425 [Calditrichaeota bacterium]|nr:MAG: hypothetical protein DWQ10_17425 [Calditrichota bacterium]
MAKKQTFESKLHRHAKGGGVKAFKLVYSSKSPKSGAWKFTERFLHVPLDEDEKQVLDNTISELEAEQK